jgi:microcystin-dependent protein
MSITDARPPRNTPNLGLPVPGDDDAADNPTVIGNLADVLDLLAAQFFHPGDLKPTGSTRVPGGWLLCDGVAYRRADYDPLFQEIGTRFGAGDGATTFNVPDLRGRVPVGAGQGAGLTNRAVGAAGGFETHTLDTNQMPAHAHGVNDPSHYHNIADPSHAHLPYEAMEYADDPNVGFIHWRISGLGTGLTASYEAVPYHFYYTAPRTRGAATGIGIYGNYTGISIQNAGGGGAHNNLQPWLATSWLIKT